MRDVASGEPVGTHNQLKNGSHQTPQEFYGACCCGKSIKRVYHNTGGGIAIANASYRLLVVAILIATILTTSVLRSSICELHIKLGGTEFAAFIRLFEVATVRHLFSVHKYYHKTKAHGVKPVGFFD
ncbi:Hok/Gef family protein [Salmonella enterica]|nr:Hok/Gef family protein [Salmonella enterica]EEN6472248.1 Hok/Gef family protein [Salmonella enterica subsp. enterica]EBQ3518252.1 Hok/Gef family protein [Salmonella enterica]EBQ3582162.1 Hok/Gef family protein [Salmonella enterica]EDZ4579371.1 Hok/Gef family protein [Salmonella enterica]